MYVCVCMCVCSPSYSRGLSAPTLRSSAFATAQFRVRRPPAKAKRSRGKRGGRGASKKVRTRMLTLNVTFELSGYSLRATVRSAHHVLPSIGYRPHSVMAKRVCDKSTLT